MFGVFVFNPNGQYTSRVLVKAMNLDIGDILSDGSVIASLSRSQGHTYAKMESGARLIAPDYYLLGVTRAPKTPKAPSPTDGSGRGLKPLEGLLEA